MAHSVTPLSSTLGEGGHPDPVDTEANKQRRKVQNRKNQRAHRLRAREQDLGSVQSQTSRPFQVRRWRLDESDDCPSQDTSSASKGTVTTYRSSQPPQKSLTPPSFTFSISNDHLLHLIQYNVFRAFVSNKRTLNTRVPGGTDNPPSLTTCPLGGPYRDDTTVYPLNPDIPLALVPTHLQQARSHSSWINLFPFPCLRDNLIRREGSYDHLELLQDLIGELMGPTPTRKRRGTPHAFNVSDPETRGTLPLAAGRDEDEVTAGRKGLIVWGEPYDKQSWEATPFFLAKWSCAVEGCDDLVGSSNRWRLMRGEEPMHLSESKR